jgi:hypothetical protein
MKSLLPLVSFLDFYYHTSHFKGVKILCKVCVFVKYGIILNPTQMIFITEMHSRGASNPFMNVTTLVNAKSQ